VGSEMCIRDRIQAEELPQEYETWGTAYTSAEEWIKTLYIGLKKEDRFNK